MCRLCDVTAPTSPTDSVDSLAFQKTSLNMSVNIGCSVTLECEMNYPNGQYSDHIMTWRKQNEEVPIFIQFNGYPPHIDESYQGRIRLVEQASIEISDIRMSDQGFYECSIVSLDAPDESNITGSWINLAVNGTFYAITHILCQFKIYISTAYSP